MRICRLRDEHVTAGPASLLNAEWIYHASRIFRRFEVVMLVGTRKPVGMVVVANGVDRAEADRLRRAGDDVVVSRNADGTYRVTRGR